MRRVFAVALCALLASVALAQSGPIQSKEFRVSGQTPPILLDGIACDAAESSRTWTATPGEALGYGVGIFQLDLTDADGSETGLTITPYVRMAGSSKWAVPMPCDATTDGTCTLTGPGAFSCTQASGCLSGNNPSLIFRTDFLGFANVRLIVACAAGATADEITLRGRITAQ